MNETLSVIKKRFACRAFSDDIPTNEEIEMIATAAIQSPSSMNSQRWQIIVVQNRSLLDEIEAEAMGVISRLPDKSIYERIQGRGGKLFYNAPFVIFIAIEPSDLVGSSLDCGIVSQTIALATKSLELDSCICSLTNYAFSKEKGDYFRERLSFADGYIFGISVLIGKAAKHGEPHEPDHSKITFIR